MSFHLISSKAHEKVTTFSKFFDIIISYFNVGVKKKRRPILSGGVMDILIRTNLLDWQS